MDLRQSLMGLEKQAQDNFAKMRVEEEFGPMKARLYDEMVSETERDLGLLGLVGGGSAGVVSTLGPHRLRESLAERALKNATAKVNAGVLESAGKGADVLQFNAHRALRDARAGMEALPPLNKRRVALGTLVGATAGAYGGADFGERIEHNRLNRKEGLGLERKPLPPSLGAALGAATGGVAGMMIPRRGLGKLQGAIIGSALGGIAGKEGTETILEHRER